MNSMLKKSIILAAPIVGGVISIIWSEIVDGSVATALVLPAALLLLFAFALKPNFLISAIFVVRAGADMLLNFTRIGGGAGLGFVLNLLLIASAVRSLLEGDERIRKAIGIWLPYLCYAAISAFAAPGRPEALKAYIAIMTLVSAFCIGVGIGNAGKQQQYIWIFLVAFALPFIWSLGMYADGAGYIIENDGVRRFAGAFGHANIMAFFCVLSSTLILLVRSDPVRSTSGFLNALLTLHMLLGLFLLFLAKTRSAWAGALLLFVMFAMFHKRRYFIYIAVVLVIIFVIPESRERVMQIFVSKSNYYSSSTNSYEWRVNLWSNALHSLSLRDWIFGRGLASFPANSAGFLGLSGGIAVGAHSIYVQAICETGLIGLSLFAIPVIKILIYLAKDFRMHSENHSAQSGLYLLISFLVFGYADNMFDYNLYNYYLFCALGMFCARSLGGECTLGTTEQGAANARSTTAA